jgi:putative ABC transport system permease protein
METFLQDLRYAMRIFRKKPGLTAVIILTLAIGIGGTTSVFTVIRAVLLRPLPYPAPEQLVQIVRTFPDQTPETTSTTQFLFWRQYSSTMSNVAAYDLIGSGLNLTSTNEPERVHSLQVSSDFFKVLQVYPAVGRDFNEQDDRANSQPVVILSSELWKRRFFSDPAIIGKPITLNGESYTVIGVTPATFTFSPAAELWTPLRAEMDPNDQTNLYKVIGRMKPGVAFEQVQADLRTVGEQFRKEYPKLMNDNESVGVRSYHSSLVGNVRTSLLILFGVVGFVLLIACFNVANLLLARSNSRRKEMSLRLAVGASSRRIVRQLLTEGIFLATLGAVVGVLLSVWGLPVLLSLSPGDLPRVGEIKLDPFVLLFALAITFFSTLVFGLAPALVALKVDINSVLKESSQTIGGRAKRLFQNSLVIIEFSLSLVMLVGAVVLIESYVRLNQIKPGFETKNVLTMQMSLNGSQYKTTAQMETLYQQVASQLERLPGVEAIATVTNLPTEKGPGLPFDIVGAPNDAGDTAGNTQWRAVTAHYFDVMHIPVLRGRGFNETDTANSLPVAIINEALARQYFSNRNPLGEHITIGRIMGPRFQDAPRNIVGVIGNVRELGLEKDAPPAIFVPANQIPDAYTQLINRVVPLSWVIRTSTDPAKLIEPVRQEALAAKTGQPVANLRPLEAVLGKTLARQHFNMLLLSVFAAMALILSAGGLYSLLSYAVTERSHEIGIRMALGAQPKSVLLLIMSHAMKLMLIGLAIGLGAAFLFTRLLAGMLFEGKTAEPMVFLGVSLLLALVALVASYIPARRAAHVNAMIALRQS